MIHCKWNNKNSIVTSNIVKIAFQTHIKTGKNQFENNLKYKTKNRLRPGYICCRFPWLLSTLRKVASLS